MLRSSPESRRDAAAGRGGRRSSARAGPALTMSDRPPADRTARLLLRYFREPSRFRAEALRPDAPRLDGEVVLKLALGRRIEFAEAALNRLSAVGAARCRSVLRAANVLPPRRHAVPDAGPGARRHARGDQGQLPAADAAGPSRPAGRAGALAGSLRGAGQPRLRDAPERGIARGVRPRRSGTRARRRRAGRARRRCGRVGGAWRPVGRRAATRRGARPSARCCPSG